MRLVGGGGGGKGSPTKDLLEECLAWHKEAFLALVASTSLFFPLNNLNGSSQ